MKPAARGREQLLRHEVPSRGRRGLTVECVLKEFIHHRLEETDSAGNGAKYVSPLFQVEP